MPSRPPCRIRMDPIEAKLDYYDYTGAEATELMEDILSATIGCFDPDFASDHLSEMPILEFFREIGITDLAPERFKTAFLH